MLERWNRCDECGRCIPYSMFGRGATRTLIEPDSEFGAEVWETKHKDCGLAGKPEE